MDKYFIKDCIVCNGANFEPYLSCKDHTVSQTNFVLQKCTNCGFVFTQNVPTEENISSYYEAESYISHSDTKQGLTSKLYHFGREWMLKKKRNLVNTHANKGTLLDVGAGTGYFLNTMQKSGWAVEGIEPSETARNIAKDNFGLGLNEPSTLFKKQDQKYDAITLWHVLEHIYTPKNYLKQFSALLSEKGILIIAVPNHTSPDAAHYMSDWAAYDVPRHIWHFNPKTIKELVEQHNFKLVKMERMPLDAYYVSLLSEKYRSGQTKLIKAVVKGFQSNFTSLFDRKKCSSVIYIFQKK